MNDSPQTGAVVAPASVPAWQPEAYIDADGFLIDEAGEVIGLLGSTDADAIRCDADADAALEVRSQIEGRLAGLNARRRSLLANLDAQIARETRKLAWWERRFLSVLTAYARTRITERHRTAQFTWGRVSFRKTPPNTFIVDDAAAVAFVKRYAPDLVRVQESVSLKAVDAASLKAVESEELFEPLPFLVTSQPGESVTVSTGVEKEPRP